MEFFDIDKRLLEIDKKALEKSQKVFGRIDQITEYNQQKVLAAFIKNRVSEAHLGTATGYGYGDIGRDNLDRVLADALSAEDALIRHSFASGTHTLTVALFGLLRPNDKMLCVTGRPYDTLIGVLGIDKKSDGSLADFGVVYDEVALKNDGTVDLEGIKARLKQDKYKMVYIQRSRGYSLRPSLKIADNK